MHMNIKYSYQDSKCNFATYTKAIETIIFICKKIHT
jgi:hypothetical protein